MKIIQFNWADPMCARVQWICNENRINIWPINEFKPKWNWTEQSKRSRINSNSSSSSHHHHRVCYTIWHCVQLVKVKCTINTLGHFVFNCQEKDENVYLWRPDMVSFIVYLCVHIYWKKLETFINRINWA